jgi:hypothetical protein
MAKAPGRQARTSRRRGSPVGPDPDRRQQPNRLIPKTPQGVIQCYRTRAIEPLEVIDRDNHRALRRQAANHSQERGTHGPWLRRTSHRILQQQRHPQGVLLRRRQPGKHPIDNPSQQIAKCCKRQRRLSLSRTARQHQIRPYGRVSHPSRPHRRLADPGLARKQQTGQTRRHPIQKDRYYAKLTTAPEHTTDLGHGRLLRQVTRE